MEDLQSILLALALGSLIGLERKFHDHSTGIHTHALVAIGAALFLLLGRKVAAPQETSRVAAQVVMGIGFLGGAVIIRAGAHIRGINTAVTLWCSSAIGAMCGAGMVELPAESALIVLGANYVLHLVEHSSGWFTTTHERPSRKENKR